MHNRHIAFYGELYGHNYYGFENTGETGVFSINAAWRQKIIPDHFYCFASVGWGIFREKHSSQVPYQPRVYYYDHINFVPAEAGVQIGAKRNFFEFGAGIVPGYGTQYLSYTGAYHTSAKDTINQGFEYFVHIGYSFYAYDGFFFKAEYCPHYFPSAYKRYMGDNLQKPDWISFGISAGWAW